MKTSGWTHFPGAEFQMESKLQLITVDETTASIAPQESLINNDPLTLHIFRKKELFVRDWLKQYSLHYPRNINNPKIHVNCDKIYIIQLIKHLNICIVFPMTKLLFQKKMFANSLKSTNFTPSIAFFEKKCLKIEFIVNFEFK